MLWWFLLSVHICRALSRTLQYLLQSLVLNKALHVKQRIWCLVFHQLSRNISWQWFATWTLLLHQFIYDEVFSALGWNMFTCFYRQKVFWNSKKMIALLQVRRSCWLRHPVETKLLTVGLSVLKPAWQWMVKHHPGMASSCFSRRFE